MFNLSSHYDQVSNFIVYNAYFGKTFKFRLNLQCYGNKIKYKCYNPFIYCSFDLIKCFSAFKNYQLSFNDL